jgi:hypothetical protein
MALVVKDRVQESTNTTGTGTLTLAGAVTGYQSFSAIGNANTTYYTITDGTLWEVGLGTYTSSGTTLSRDTVLSSSAGGVTKISVTAGSYVFCGYPADKAMLLNSSNIASGYAVILPAGTTALAPLQMTSGTNLTAAVAGGIEYDGNRFYASNNTTMGRGLLPTTQYHRLSADGSTISTIAPFFGSTTAIPLIASGIYEIDIEVFFLKNTAGTVTWQLTNSTTVTNMTARVFTSPVAGYTGAPTGSTTQIGALIAQTSATAAFTATASISNNANMYSQFKIFLENGSSTSFKLQATVSAGTITPRRGSFWKSKLITDVGTLTT